MSPVISQETPDLPEVAGEHEKDPSNQTPPHLTDG